jgi:hypothetical protein
MKYVIMLDKDLGRYAYDWPVVKRSDSLDQLREETQWNGGNPERVLRTDWDMERIESKSLENARDATSYTGAIYEQTKKRMGK